MNKFKLFFLFLLFMTYGLDVWGAPVAADIAFAKLSKTQDLTLRHIDIDSNFSGMKMLLFGARREAGDVVVVVRGPDTNYLVRKKTRIAGIWVNKKQVKFDKTNAFFAVASSKDLVKLGNDSLLDELGIENDNIIWAYPSLADVPVKKIDFLKALIERKKEQNLYSSNVNKIDFIGDSLFRTTIDFPSNIPRGTYTIEVYLFEEGKLFAVQSIPMLVGKKGFDAFVFDLAHNWPTLYGIIAVSCALLAGWAAGTLFRRI